MNNDRIKRMVGSSLFELLEGLCPQSAVLHEAEHVWGPKGLRVIMV